MPTSSKPSRSTGSETVAELAMLHGTALTPFALTSTSWPMSGSLRRRGDQFGYSLKGEALAGSHDQPQQAVLGRERLAVLQFLKRRLHPPENVDQHPTPRRPERPAEVSPVAILRGSKLRSPDARQHNGVLVDGAAEQIAQRLRCLLPRHDRSHRAPDPLVAFAQACAWAPRRRRHPLSCCRQIHRCGALATRAASAPSLSS